MPRYVQHTVGSFIQRFYGFRYFRYVVNHTVITGKEFDSGHNSQGK